MHLNFQIKFSPTLEYLLQYFFFGVITNILFMGTHMQTYLCAHSHVHLYVWDPEASFKCSSSKNFIYLFGDSVSHYLEPLQLGYCVLSGRPRNLPVSATRFWALNYVPPHLPFLCRFWCSNSFPLAFKASALLMESFSQPKSQPPLRRSK